MTDMHREAFEKWAKSLGYIFLGKEPDGSYESQPLDRDWTTWQAAMRYRDEQEKQA